MATAVLAFWFIAAFGLSVSGVLDRVPSAIVMAAGALVPAGIYFALYAGSRGFRQFVHSRPLRLLTGLESPRICGFLFLIAYHCHTLPGRYALPTAISDMTVGITALFAAFLLVSRDGKPKPGLLAWHWFGLLAIVMSGSLGTLTSASPVGLLRTSISSQAMSSFPLNLVPTFLGPVTLLLHLMALTILLAPGRRRRAGREIPETYAEVYSPARYGVAGALSRKENEGGQS